MIVSQAEIEAITRRKLRRRMMRLPAETRPDGSLKPCPFRHGRAYKLQSARREKATTVTITAAPRREKLAALVELDAKREGYAGVAGALEAWRRAHGEADLDTQVWVVEFILGDESEMFSQDVPLFLAKDGGYTSQRSRQAVPGDPEVIDAEAAARFARDSRKRRMDQQQQAVSQAAGNLEMLRESIESMKARQLLKKAARAVRAAVEIMPSDAPIDFSEALLELGPRAEGSTSTPACPSTPTDERAA